MTFAPACAVPGLSGVGFCELAWPCCPEVFVLEEPLGLVVVDAVPVGFGLGLVDVGVVEVEVEVEVVVAGWALVVTVAAGVVAVTCGHEKTTLVIGSWRGGAATRRAVPAGTFWSVNCWPPVDGDRVTVQPSADASGMAATPSTATTRAVVTAATLSFRLFNTVAYSSRGLPLAMSVQLRSQVALEGRYWLPPSFAIQNR